MAVPDVADGDGGQKGSGLSRDSDAEWRISDPRVVEPVPARSHGNEGDRLFSSEGEEDNSQKRSGHRREMPGDRSPIPGSTGSGKDFSTAGSFSRCSDAPSLPSEIPPYDPL